MINKQYYITPIRNPQRGFTVVETLVALGILVIGLSGGFAAVSTSLRSTTLSKEQVTAFYLAQEAVELVRYVRDTNSLQGNNWLHGLAENVGDPCGDEKICYVDGSILPIGWGTCSASDWTACPVLRKHDTSHYYTYNTGGTSPTIFTRSIQITRPVITNVPADDVIGVEVRVTWPRPNGGMSSYVVHSILYDLR